MEKIKKSVYKELDLPCEFTLAELIHEYGISLDQRLKVSEYYGDVMFYEVNEVLESDSEFEHRKMKIALQEYQERQQYLKEKKIKDWFQELEEPYRTLALGNLKEECKEECTDSLSGALAEGFVWHKTKQGYKYWDRLFDELGGTI